MYLQGRVDIDSSPNLRDHLLAMLRKPSPPETIIIDLKQVSYIDTSGIATLIEGLKIARIGSISMHLQGLQGHLLHLFQTTGEPARGYGQPGSADRFAQAASVELGSDQAAERAHSPATKMRWI